jgi:hypothetical protein
MPILQSGAVAFWMGLAGILGTGFIVALDGVYWDFAKVGFNARGQFAVIVFAAFAGVGDLSAFGVIFVGGVLAIQRLRGRE